MPLQAKPLPPGLTDWVSRKHPGAYAKFVEARYVLSDAWNGTVYVFELRQPGIPKSVFSVSGCAFALDQFREPPDWTWEFFGGPITPDPKTAVLRALRNSTPAERR
jgi:hypothetical protein